MKPLAMVFGLSTFIYAGTLQAQDACRELIKYGLWENNFINSSESSASQAREWFCNESYEQSQDSKNASFKGFGLNAVFGGESADKQRSQACGDKTLSATEHKQLEAKWSRASAILVDAYQNCLNKQTGLIAWLREVPKEIENEFEVAIKFVPIMKGQYLDEVRIETGPGVTCSPKKWWWSNTVKVKRLDTVTQTVGCRRAGDKAAWVKVLSDVTPTGGENGSSYLAIPPKKPKGIDSIRFRFDSFHGGNDSDRIAVAISEIRLFDRAGHSVPIKAVEATSAAPDHAPANIRDGIVDDKSYWTPSGDVRSDGGQDLIVSFDHADIAKVELQQQFGAGCMHDCSGKNKKSKIRTDVKSLTMFMSNYKYQQVTLSDKREGPAIILVK